MKVTYWKIIGVKSERERTSRKQDEQNKKVFEMLEEQL